MADKRDSGIYRGGVPGIASSLDAPLKEIAGLLGLDTSNVNCASSASDQDNHHGCWIQPVLAQKAVAGSMTDALIKRHSARFSGNLPQVDATQADILSSGALSAAVTTRTMEDILNPAVSALVKEVDLRTNRYCLDFLTDQTPPEVIQETVAAVRQYEETHNHALRNANVLADFLQDLAGKNAKIAVDAVEFVPPAAPRTVPKIKDDLLIQIYAFKDQETYQEYETALRKAGVTFYERADAAKRENRREHILELPVPETPEKRAALYDVLETLNQELHPPRRSALEDKTEPDLLPPEEKPKPEVQAPRWKRWLGLGGNSGPGAGG